MSARVCIAIRESSTEAALAAARRACAWADLVEFRADYIAGFDVKRLFREKPCPALFTLRARQEGGDYTGPERDRIASIIEAAHAGADFVDVEFSAGWKTVLENVQPAQMILSYHNFEETPEGLESRLDTMAASGAGILKIATRARRLADNARIACLLKHARARGLQVLALAMGRAGTPSRILGGLWGSWATFASLPGGESTAEGQVPADLLLKLYRFRDIGTRTRVYGVLGRPLGHSLSPQVHNAAFEAQRRDAVFIPLEAESVQDFVEFQRACRLSGCSVTIPFKEQVRAILRSVSATANQIGAVNTLATDGDGWHGENTDVDGFLRPLIGRLELSRMRSVVLGSGGAARAAVYALRSQGSSVCIVARNAERARSLAEDLQAECAPWEELRSIRWNLLVNATPVGMYPNVYESPLRPECLTGEWVYDLVYNPAETRLLKDAAGCGCKTITGLEMFLGQALRQQELWFGGQGPEEVMREELVRALATDH